MAVDLPIQSLDVFPDYGKGFLFAWEVSPSFEEPGPWEFLVQAGESENGPWRDISGVMPGACMWRCDGPVRVGKARALSFRVLMRTGSGVHASAPVSPYGTLGRRDFLVGRDVMRRELLHMRGMAGVEVLLFKRTLWGPRCGCVDPITGRVRDSHCRMCLGTGRVPPYRGPCAAWAVFSEDRDRTVGHAQGGVGMVEPKGFSARLLSSVPLFKNDVVRDVASGKMYYVDSSAVAAEIRRVPLVQTATVMEAAATDPVYLQAQGFRNGF